MWEGFLGIVDRSWATFMPHLPFKLSKANTDANFGYPFLPRLCRQHLGQPLTCVWDIWRGVMMWLIFVQNLHRSKRRREVVSAWQPQELPINSFNVAHWGPLWPIVAWIASLEKVTRAAERGVSGYCKIIKQLITQMVVWSYHGWGSFQYSSAQVGSHIFYPL